MWLWNLTLRELFALPRLSCWQAFRPPLIAGMLFGALHATLSPGSEGFSL